MWNFGTDPAAAGLDERALKKNTPSYRHAEIAASLAASPRKAGNRRPGGSTHCGNSDVSPVDAGDRDPKSSNGRSAGVNLLGPMFDCSKRYAHPKARLGRLTTRTARGHAGVHAGGTQASVKALDPRN